MSQHEPDFERQKQRHRVPLWGMAAVVVFAVAMIVIWMFEQAGDAAGPQGSPVQIDGRSGAPEAAAPLPPPPAAPGEGG